MEVSAAPSFGEMNKKADAVVAYVKSSPQFDETLLQDSLYKSSYLDHLRVMEPPSYSPNRKCAICRADDAECVDADFTQTWNVYDIISEECLDGFSPECIPISGDGEGGDLHSPRNEEEEQIAEDAYEEIAEDLLDGICNHRVRMYGGRSVPICTDCSKKNGVGVLMCGYCRCCVADIIDTTFGPQEIKQIDFYKTEMNICTECSEHVEYVDCLRCHLTGQPAGLMLKDIGGFCSSCSVRGSVEEIARALNDVCGITTANPKWRDEFEFIDPDDEAEYESKEEWNRIVAKNKEIAMAEELEMKDEIKEIERTEGREKRKRETENGVDDGYQNSKRPIPQVTLPNLKE